LTGAGLARPASFTRAVLAILGPLYAVAAMVPVAWALAGFDTGELTVAVSTATVAVAAVQSAVAAILAARRSGAGTGVGTEGTGRGRVPVRRIGRAISSSCLGIAALMGPLAMWASLRHHGLVAWPHMLEHGLIFLITQAAISPAACCTVDARARALLGDTGPIRRGRRRLIGTEIFRALVTSATIMALGLGLCAHRALNAESFAGTAANYRRLAEGVVGLIPLGAPGEDGEETLVDALARFDEAHPFVVDDGGKWRRWFDREEADALEDAFRAAPEGAVFNEWTGVGATWTTISGSGRIVGVRLVGIGGEVLPYVVAALLFAAAFGSAIVSIRAASWFREQIASRADDLRLVPEAAPASRAAMTVEVGMLDEALAGVWERTRGIRESHARVAEEAQAAREKKARIFTSMSHDIRSPLNSVIGFTDLLLKGIDGDLNAGQRETVSRIAQHSERLMVIISDILDTAKLDSGSFELDRAWVPSVEILTECVAGAQRLVASRTVEFASQLEPGLPPVWVDKDRVCRALLSLIARVIDSMERGTVKLRAARVRGRADGAGTLGVEIIDAGNDMDEAWRGRMAAAFDRSGTATIGGEESGLGLGLSLARRILNLHGGDVEVDTRGGGGLKLRVTIPLEDLAAD